MCRQVAVAQGCVAWILLEKMCLTPHSKLSFGRGLASARDKGHDDSGLGSDGLPVPGMRLTKGSALYSVVDENTGTEKITRHKHDDAATVSQVTIVGTGPRG